MVQPPCGISSGDAAFRATHAHGGCGFQGFSAMLAYTSRHRGEGIEVQEDKIQ
jgi:hypothetical protein